MNAVAPIEGRAPRPHGRARLWQQMRIHRHFTAEIIATGAETSIVQSRTYCRLLSRVGVLRAAGRRPITYQLLPRWDRKDAPRIYNATTGAAEVYDPNTGTLLREQDFAASGTQP